MLNIVIPMAGAGSRFAKAGYTVPKPMISVHGIPMIRLVIANLRPQQPHRFIFIAQNSHMQQYNLKADLSRWAPGCEIIGIDGLTEGAACTVLKARDLINTHDQLMIANSDQYVDININDYLDAMRDKDGMVMTMYANDPKWSFIEKDCIGHITRIVEKEVISPEATVGIYNFRHGFDFVTAAEEMIASDMRVNGEFYVAPAYNLLIVRGQKHASYNIGTVGNGMHGLGTPADLDDFLKLALSKKAVEEIL